MNWKTLDRIEGIEEIIEKSTSKPQAIFKHSTRCHISKTVKHNLEADWTLADDKMDVYYLDLLSHRDISNAIAQRLDARHESPQMLVIDHGKLIYCESHQDIEASTVAGSIASA